MTGWGGTAAAVLSGADWSCVISHYQSLCIFTIWHTCLQLVWHVPPGLFRKWRSTLAQAAGEMHLCAGSCKVSAYMLAHGQAAGGRLLLVVTHHPHN